MTGDHGTRYLPWPIGCAMSVLFLMAGGVPSHTPQQRDAARERTFSGVTQ